MTREIEATFVKDPKNTLRIVDKSLQLNGSNLFLYYPKFTNVIPKIT